MRKKNNFGNIAGIAAIILLISSSLFMLSSCSNKVDVPVDPVLVEKFVAVDNLMESTQKSETVEMGFADNASGAIFDLIEVLGLQMRKYSNPKQKSDLKNCTLELGEIYAHASNLGYNPSIESVDVVYNEWMKMRPKLRPFVGKAADSTPPPAK